MDPGGITINQFEHSQTIAKVTNNVKSKQNVLDEYKKLLKYLETNNNSYSAHSLEPLYPNVAMVYSIKAWTFWYRNATKTHANSCPWEESLTKIETVRDINGLWKVLNHIVQPSVKHVNISLFVFDENSVPAWEHNSNENAGRWIIVLNDNRDLHNVWNNTVLQVIGDKFSSVTNDINGIGLHIKAVYSKITVWTTKTTLKNYKNIYKIGIMCREIIGPVIKSMHYYMHNRVLHKGD